MQEKPLSSPQALSPPDALPAPLRRLRLKPGSREAALALPVWEQALILAAPRTGAARLEAGEFARVFARELAESTCLRERLQGRPVVWLLAATLGPELERRVGALFAAGEAFAGFVLDACGTYLADQALRGAMARVAPPGTPRTRRLAPGFRDVPLRAQTQLLALAGRDADGASLGISVNTAWALTPRMTVTAIVGVGG